MYEIYTILVIFLEQMDLKTTLKTLIKKVTKIGYLRIIDI